MRNALLVLAMLCWATLAQAQAHYCDTTPPASATVLAGTVVQLHACHPSVDTNNNPITGIALYDGATRTVPTWTKGTANAAGVFEWTASFTAPAGAHTLTVAALSGALESPKSNPFVLTGTLPQTAPVAPTKFSGQ